MMAEGFPIIDALLPHAHPMILLDAVIESSADSLTAAVTIRSDSPFAVEGEGVPAHVGIEYMAQACGAFAGLEAHRAGQPVQLGFLLGTRRFQASVPWFSTGWPLQVTVTVVFQEDRMGVFDCRIRHGDAVIATAQLTVYQSDDQASTVDDQH
jgi:predicted hotdog family 3-hydroxylacyl-ACP dehydratase